jgi:hypothetical protein
MIRLAKYTGLARLIRIALLVGDRLCGVRLLLRLGQQSPLCLEQHPNLSGRRIGVCRLIMRFINELDTQLKR